VPADYYRDLIRLLKEGGCHFVRTGKGSHEIWYSPITKRSFTVPRAKRSHTANEVLKQAGLPKAF
jgi:predicted RNA binding protein YcfA (HicA-like mRNA interferase family)